MKIELSKKQTEAFKVLEDSSTTELLYGGAAGGGKDYLACVWHIFRRIQYPETRGFIGRETHKALMGSTYNTFVNVLNAMGLQMGVDCKFNGRTGELKWSNNSSTIFGYLERDTKDPNYNRLGSTEFTDVIINEAVECEERAVNILKSRIRYNISNTIGRCPKLLLLSNPSECWLKYRFIRNADGNPVILKPTQKYIQATLFDNPFIDPTYLNNLREMNEYDQKRLIEGDWDAVPKLGGEFFERFDYNKHTGEVPYNRELPVWVSVDNNVLPYIAVSVWQSDKNNRRLYQIGEVCTPESTATNAGLSTGKYLRDRGITSKVYVTGDPSTRSRNTLNEDKKTFIELFEQGIIENNVQIIDRMLYAAPSVYTSGDFVNEILNGYNGWSIKIDQSKCRLSITDYQSVKKDSDGSMLKERYKNDYGATYEKFGHLSDTFRYFIIACLEIEYHEWSNRNIVQGDIYEKYIPPSNLDIYDTF